MPTTPGSTIATTPASPAGPSSRLTVALLPRCHGAMMAVRLPESSDWLIQPSAPSASRTRRHVSYSWMISIGRPALVYIQSTE